MGSNARHAPDGGGLRHRQSLEEGGYRSRAAFVAAMTTAGNKLFAVAAELGNLAMALLLSLVLPVVCGLWSVVCGLWSVICGLWSVVCGLWSVVCGLRSAVCNLRTADADAQVLQRIFSIETYFTCFS